MNLAPKSTPTARQRTFFVRPPLASPRFCVRGIGIRDVLPACTIDRPRGTSDYLILCPHDQLEIDPSGTRLRPGEVIVWAPGARQFYRNRAGLRHSWIHCHGSLIDDLMRRCGVTTGAAIAPGSAALCDRALDALRCELLNPRPDEDITACIMQAWLLALARNQRRDHAPAPPAPYAAIRTQIDNGFAEQLHLDSLAARAGVSVQHFGRTYRALFGESPIAYQLRLRLEHAAWLLRDVERSISAIADDVGYADLYQFSRAFARRYGCSPRRWRQRLLAGQ